MDPKVKYFLILILVVGLGVGIYFAISSSPSSSSTPGTLPSKTTSETKKPPVVPENTTCTGFDPKFYTNIGSSMNGGSSLGLCQAIVSPDNSHMLVVQSDGNVVEYNTSNGKVLFTTNQYGNANKPNTMTLQTNGNFVQEDSKNNILWNTNVYNKGVAPYSVRVQNDGNLIVADSANALVWSSNVYNQ